jgi:hypothetical protein
VSDVFRRYLPPAVAFYVAMMGWYHEIGPEAATEELAHAVR